MRHHHRRVADPTSARWWASRVTVVPPVDVALGAAVADDVDVADDAVADDVDAVDDADDTDAAVVDVKGLHQDSALRSDQRDAS